MKKLITIVLILTSTQTYALTQEETIDRISAIFAMCNARDKIIKHLEKGDIPKKDLSLIRDGILACEYFKNLDIDSIERLMKQIDKNE